MDLVQKLESVSSNLETAALNACPPATVPDRVTHTHLLRMKERMSNQCFEMNVKVNMGKSKRSCDVSDTDADISKWEDEIEEARITHYNKTLALNRMQVWNSVCEKLIQNDADAESMKALANHNVNVCLKTMNVLKESRELQDQITELQKERLELKVLTKKKMQEMNELKKIRENQGEMHKRTVQRAEDVLEKYQKIATISQNVLRGIILASKVNWNDDPKLRDIAMGLENIPN